MGNLITSVLISHDFIQYWAQHSFLQPTVAGFKHQRFRSYEWRESSPTLLDMK